jgi:hypothetical protein
MAPAYRGRGLKSGGGDCRKPMRPLIWPEARSFDAGCRIGPDDHLLIITIHNAS